MAVVGEVSSIQLPNGNEYEILDKDAALAKTPTDISATEETFVYQKSSGESCKYLTSIKGNSIVWNNLIRDFASWGASRGTVSVSGNVLTYTVTNATGGTTQYAGDMGHLNISGGHRYYISFCVKTDYDATIYLGGDAFYNISRDVQITGGVWHSFHYLIPRPQSLTGVNFYIALSMRTEGSVAVGDKMYIKDVIYTDLTFAFGTGKEPSSVDTFEAWLAHSGCSLPTSYTPGILRNNSALAIETTMFNQWDEERLTGVYETSDGETYTAASGYLCSKNKIPVFAGQTYYVKAPAAFRYFFYDESGAFINTATTTANSTIEIPSDVGFMRFQLPYASAYNNDICINLSDASRNGTYEPYWQRVLALRLSELTGIPEGGTEADRVTMFPNGLGGAGSAFDSLFVENGVTKARKTMVNIKGEDIFFQDSGQGAGIYRTAMIPTIANFSSWSGDIKSNKYMPRDSSGFAPDKVVGTIVGQIWVKDVAYATVADYNAAVQAGGFEFLCVLATPIVYTDLQYADGTPFELPGGIIVDKDGTERAIFPEHGDGTPSAPFCCNSFYGTISGEFLSDRIDSEDRKVDAIYDILEEQKTDIESPSLDPSEQSVVGIRQSGGDGACYIKTIDGCTRAWNQLLPKNGFQTATIRGITFTNNLDGSLTLNGTATGGTAVVQYSFNFIAGHKYYIPSANLTDISFSANNNASWTATGRGVFTATTQNIMAVAVGNGVTVNNVKVWPWFVDLTLFYGSKISGMTDAEILAKFEHEYPAPYYPYDAGSLLNNDADALVSRGRNAWDEEWEKGSLNSSGEEIIGDCIRSKNYCPALPNTLYFINDPSSLFVVYFYDANKEMIPYTGVGKYSNGYNGGAQPFTTPADTRYFRFRTASTYGITYKNDICINLSDPAFNGRYEPYKRAECKLGLKAIKVKSPNIWDEEWEVGGVVWNTGADYAVTDRIRSKNYFPILPNTSYYITNKGNGNVGICFYDANKQRISSNDAAASGNAFSSPDGACYARIATNASYGATYGNDICLSISNPMFNGKYFPHGILTFNGLNGVETLRDRKTKDKLHKKFVVVDLGELTWTYQSNGIFIANGNQIPGIKASHDRILVCPIYPFSSASSSSDVPDKSIANNQWVAASPEEEILVKDTSYSNAATFKNAMSGVNIIIELAVEEVYELAEPILPYYLVDGGGTEQAIYGDNKLHAPCVFEAFYAPITTEEVDRKIEAVNERVDYINEWAYSKPSGGIPKTDLASGVQTSLGKADTALQSVSVVDSSPTLSWGNTSQIATIAGTGISVKMPSNPATGKADASTTVTNVSYNSGTGKLQKTINGSTTDITSIITSHQSVSSTTPAATWGASVQVGTVGGTGLGFVMPANPATGKADKNGSSSEDFSAALLSATSLKGGVRILDNSGSGASIQVEDSFIIFSKVQGASVSLPSGSNGQTHLLITTNGGTLYGPIGAMGPSDMRIFYGNGIGMYTSPSLGFSAGEVFFLAYGDGYWNVIQIVQM